MITKSYGLFRSSGASELQASTRMTHAFFVRLRPSVAAMLPLELRERRFALNSGASNRAGNLHIPKSWRT
jgi:hypothetical protein